MTKQEVLDRMNAGEKLRWISREVSGVPCEKAWQEGLRDLFLGKQILSTDELCIIHRLEADGDIICEDTFGDVIRYWLPGERPQ